MDRETEGVRQHLKSLSPAERARLARETEEEMRFPHRREAEAKGSEKERQDGGSLGGFLVSGHQGDHLPSTRGGKIDHQLMGAAWAALHEGYRGNKYEGPDKKANPPAPAAWDGRAAAQAERPAAGPARTNCYREQRHGSGGAMSVA